MISSYLILLAIPIVIATLITPLVIKLAHRIGAIDKPDARKVHTRLMPRLGGVSIFISFFCTFFIGMWLFPELFHQVQWNSASPLLLSGSLLAILLLGIWDDIQPISPGKKFTIQFLIATMIFYAGIKITTLINPFTNQIVEVGFLAYPLTIIWIIGVTNAFNLIDGLDGLASGVALISAISILCIGFLNNDPWTILMVIMLAGSLIGFLFYNFNPARIFLGDSGSLFLGFLISVISIQSYTKITTAYALIIPVLILGLPLIDTSMAMLRRFLNSYLGKKQTDKQPSFLSRLHTLFLPDRSHIHHQLISRGLSHRTTVIILYVVSIFLGAGAYLVFYLGTTVEAGVILVLTAALIVFGIKKLKYQEMELLRNGLFLGAYKRVLAEQPYKQAILDLLFIIIAFSISYYLIDRVTPQILFNGAFNLSLIAGVLIQVTIFALFRVYRETKYPANTGNLVHLIKTVAVAIFATGLTLTLLNAAWSHYELLFYVLNFYLLTTFVIGHRVLYHVLNFFYIRYQADASPFLLYGASDESIHAVNYLLSRTDNLYRPLGYLDDDPSLEGRFFNGYPIFGGHWKLERLLKKYPIKNILLTSDSIRPESLRRIRNLAMSNGITLQRLYRGRKGLQLRNLPLVQIKNVPNFTFQKYVNS